MRHAFALARTDRVSAAIGAAERALSLNGHDAELADLLAAPPRRRAPRPSRRLIAWVEPSPGREAMGDPPDGWTIAPWPEDAASAPDRDQVEFVVPNWEISRDLDVLPALKVVQTRSAGVDWIVDQVPEGVTLCSARGTRDPAMAEWVLWAILADMKAGGVAARQQAAHDWEHLDLRDLHGARVLILGHGSIGAAVEERLAPFGVAEVVRVARRARDGVHGVEELAGLLPDADVVVNILPATPQTERLLDADMLRAMRARRAARQRRARRDGRHRRAARRAPRGSPARRPRRRRARAAAGRPSALGRAEPDPHAALGGRHAGRRARGLGARRASSFAAMPRASRWSTSSATGTERG